MSLGTIFAFFSAFLFALILIAALCRLADRFSEPEPLSPTFTDTTRERLTVWARLVAFGVFVGLFEFMAVYFLSGTDMDLSLIHIS